MNLIELIRPQNMVAYWDDSKANQQRYMGDWLFPHKKVVGLELSKVSGRAGLPVQLKASAFDTQPTYRDRIGVELKKTKLPFFRERMKIDEETRQQIMAISNDALLANYLGRIFDDVGNLRRGAKAQRERMAMELISTGHVKIEGNGVKLDYNYGMNKNQFVKPSTAWTDTVNSNPLKDLSDWVDFAQTKYNVNMGYAIMTPKTFNLIKANENVIKSIYPNSINASSLFVTTQQVKDVIMAASGLTVLINKDAYADEVGGVSKQFFPDYKVTLIPQGGVLGNMIFGTTPEEAELYINPRTRAYTSIVDTGVAIYTRLIDVPVNVETVVSQIVLPSFSADVEGGAGSILVANVE